MSFLFQVKFINPWASGHMVTVTHNSASSIVNLLHLTSGTYGFMHVCINYSWLHKLEELSACRRNEYWLSTLEVEVKCVEVTRELFPLLLSEEIKTLDTFASSVRGWRGGHRRRALFPFQLLSRQTIYDGPATIELQSFSAFPICFDALDFQTRLGGKEGLGARRRRGLN